MTCPLNHAFGMSNLDVTAVAVPRPFVGVPRDNREDGAMHAFADVTIWQESADALTHYLQMQHDTFSILCSQ